MSSRMKQEKRVYAISFCLQVQNNEKKPKFKVLTLEEILKRVSKSNTSLTPIPTEFEVGF